MIKSEVYSWRLSPATKSSLEEVARREQATMAALLERIVTDWLSSHHSERSQEESEQRRVREAAARTFGTIRGSNPSRSEQVRRTVRTKLAKRHAR
jgi:hypothetical protein